MRRTLLLLFWLVSDLALFLGAYALAYVLRVGFIFSTNFPLDRYLLATCMAAPVWMGMLLVTRTFGLTRSQSSPRNAAYIVYACIVGSAAFALSYYFLYGLFFSRSLLVVAFLFSAVLTWAWHIVFEILHRRCLRGASPVFPTLIVGVTREAADLIGALERAKSPLKPVAILDARGTKQTAIHGVPVLGRLHRLEETIASKGITHLIQCSDLEHSINLLSVCREHGITYLLLPSVLGIIGGDEQVEILEGHPVTVVRPKQSWWMRFFA